VRREEDEINKENIKKERKLVSHVFTDLYFVYSKGDRFID
jgi:hypothetical protein